MVAATTVVPKIFCSIFRVSPRGQPQPREEEEQKPTQQKASKGSMTKKKKKRKKRKKRKVGEKNKTTKKTKSFEKRLKQTHRFPGVLLLRGHTPLVSCGLRTRSFL